MYLMKIREIIYYYMKVSLNALFSFFIPINACFLEVWDDICKFYSLNLPLQVNRCSFLSEDHVTYCMKEVPMKKKSPKWTPTVTLFHIPGQIKSTYASSLESSHSGYQRKYCAIDQSTGFLHLAII